MCFQKETVNLQEKYEESYLKFNTDYDRENPVTKNAGNKRLMEKQLSMMTSEEDKIRLKQEIQKVDHASMMSAFNMYNAQKAVMQQ